MLAGFFLTTSRNIDSLNFYWAAFCSIIYIVFIVISFSFMLRQKRMVFLENSFAFWVNVAFLVYSSGVCLVFLFEKYLLVVDRPILILLWIYFFIPLNITKNVILGYALTKEKGS
jgi:hypothetical protein